MIQDFVELKLPPEARLKLSRDGFLKTVLLRYDLADVGSGKTIPVKDSMDLYSVQKGTIVHPENMDMLVRIADVQVRTQDTISVQEIIEYNVVPFRDILYFTPKAYRKKVNTLGKENAGPFLDSMWKTDDFFWNIFRENILGRMLISARFPISETAKLSLTTLEPYAAYNHHKGAVISEFLYVNEGVSNSYYFDDEDVLRSLYSRYREPECLIRLGKVKYRDTNFASLLHDKAGVSVLDDKPGAIDALCSSYVGKQKQQMVSELNKTVDSLRRKIEHAERKSSMEPYFHKKYSDLFHLDGPSVLFQQSLKWSAIDGDLYIEIPLRKYRLAKESSQVISRKENYRFISENRKKFFQFVKERIEMDPRVMERIGSLNLYRLSDCVVMAASEVELIFSMKEEVERVMAAGETVSRRKPS